MRKETFQNVKSAEDHAESSLCTARKESRYRNTRMP